MTSEKAQAKIEIDAAAERYMQSRDRKELELIQSVVDKFGDAYVLVIKDAKDGIPNSITFNPKEIAGDIHTGKNAPAA